MEKTGFQKWWYNLTHVRKNYQQVKASPYASLLFALKVRKVIIGILIPYLIYMCVKMVLDYSAKGFMQSFGRIVMIAIFGYLIYRIWATIPAAKKQLEYYKKYPHVINYCPSNVKEDIDDIINKIKNNKAKKEEENVRKKEKTNANGTSKSKETSGSSNTAI
jgi:hypothetical protein